MTRPQRRFAVPLVAASLAVTFAMTAVPESARADTPAGWSTVWRDDFSGPAGTGLNRAEWQYDLGHSYPGGAWNWGTGEVETMTDSPANVSLDGAGNLAITAVRDSAGNWTSGRVESARTDFAAPVGGVLRVESRLKLPDVSGASAAGYWPAFWMLGDAARPVGATNWPGVGEIDIMENINGLPSTWSTLHCGYIDGGPCNEKTGLSSGAVANSTLTSAFHTFAMEYDRSTSPEQLRFFVDGTVVKTVSSDQVDPTAWTNALHHGFFVIFNVALGGEFPGAFGQWVPTAQTASGKPMLIDYVQVSTRGGSGSTPSPSATASPTASSTPSPTSTPSATTSPSGTPSATASPSGTPGSRDARARIEAESFDAQSGTTTQTTTDTGGGQNLAGISTGDWALYKGVDFGATPATQFIARVASGAAGGASGLVEVRLDSLASAPIGSFAIANTGGWQSWQTVPANIGAVTGVHDVYVTFTSGQPTDYVALNWLTFGPASATPTASASPSATPTVSASPTGSPSPSATASPSGTPGSRDARARIEAESFDAQSGTTTQTTTDTGGGQNLAGISTGDWSLYKGVDFGTTPATQFIARVASGAAGGASGLVEVRLDSLASAPIGSFAVANTGGWQSWQTVPANITAVAGVHDVYVTFTSGQPTDYVALNWLTFG